MRTASLLTLPLEPFAWARARVRTRFRAWWQARLPRTDTLLLTQRNIYILPTRAGLLFAGTLLLLLVASINYQLNLGYLLTFVLAGSGIVSMHLTHATLRGLTLHLHPVDAVHAGDAALLELTLTTPRAARWGIGLRVEAAPRPPAPGPTFPKAGKRRARELRARSARPPRRADADRRDALPARPVSRLGGLAAGVATDRLSGARAAGPAVARGQRLIGGPAQARRSEGADFEGIRGYRRGDPLKLVVWKKAARAFETGGELVSRDSSSSAHWQLWLAWQHCAGLADEERLSRLAAWVLAAHRAGATYGLAPARPRTASRPGRSAAPGLPGNAGPLAGSVRWKDQEPVAASSLLSAHCCLSPVSAS